MNDAMPLDIPTRTAAAPDHVGQICTRCIMDGSDPQITFDERGVCNHCQRFDRLASLGWMPNEAGRRRLDRLRDRIVRSGRGRDYDCIIGVSGGVDSSYLLHLATRELGLRVLAVHVDCGWNSELAVANIDRMVGKLGVDLVTVVVDWAEVRELQKAFLRSGIENQDIVQDHAFAAQVYAVAARHGIRYLLNGGNFATEGILPKGWGSDAMDARLIRGIHARFGRGTLRSYMLMSRWKRYVYYPYVKRIRLVWPLNFVPYGKAPAMALLESEYRWVYYGGKHYESVWTRFFQGYFLPVRYGYDKRRAHLSSLVVAGEITREEALARMRTRADLDAARAELPYVLRKLGLTRQEFEAFMSMPKRKHTDYPNTEWVVGAIERIRVLQKRLQRSDAT